VTLTNPLPSTTFCNGAAPTSRGAFLVVGGHATVCSGTNAIGNQACWYGMRDTRLIADRLRPYREPPYCASFLLVYLMASLISARLLTFAVYFTLLLVLADYKPQLVAAQS
jgi:hypothetical protein